MAQHHGGEFALAIGVRAIAFQLQLAAGEQDTFCFYGLTSLLTGHCGSSVAIVVSFSRCRVYQVASFPATTGAGSMELCRRL